MPSSSKPPAPFGTTSPPSAPTTPGMTPTSSFSPDMNAVARNTAQAFGGAQWSSGLSGNPYQPGAGLNPPLPAGTPGAKSNSSNAWNSIAGSPTAWNRAATGMNAGLPQVNYGSVPPSAPPPSPPVSYPQFATIDARRQWAPQFLNQGIPIGQIQNWITNGQLSSGMQPYADTFGRRATATNYSNQFSDAGVPIGQTQQWLDTGVVTPAVQSVLDAIQRRAAITQSMDQLMDAGATLGQLHNAADYGAPITFPAGAGGGGAFAPSNQNPLQLFLLRLLAAAARAGSY